jgi:hypothetical protein
MQKRIKNDHFFMSFYNFCDDLQVHGREKHQKYRFSEVTQKSGRKSAGWLFN